MPEDAALLDAPVEGIEEEPSLEETTEVEDQPEVATEGEPQPKAGAQPTAPAIENGKLSPAIKAHLDKIKAEDPVTARILTRALFREAELAKALPGGLKEVRELRATMEQLGGANGIKDIQAELSGWQQLDNDFAAGDPKAIDFMTSSPELQGSFLKLMPTVFQKFEELHPEGFTHYMAQVMSGTMQAGKVPLALERLADLVADNPKALEYLNVVRGTMKWIEDTAAKTVPVPTPKGEAAPDARVSDLDQREMNLTRQEWKSASAQQQAPVYQKTWNDLAAGRKISDLQRAGIEEIFESQMAKLSKAEGDTLNRYAQAKDREGFLRYAASLDRKFIPQALRKGFDAIMPGKPGPRPGVAKPIGTAPLTPPLKAPAGFTQIPQQPPTSDIDMTRTNTKMFQEGQAVLKDGRRVTWKKRS